MLVFGDDYEPIAKQLREGIEILSTKADILVERYESNIRKNTERLNNAVMSIKNSKSYLKLKKLDPAFDTRLEDITSHFYGGTDYFKNDKDVLKRIVESIEYLSPPAYLDEAMNDLFNNKSGMNRFVSKFGTRTRYNDLLRLIVDLQVELEVESKESAQEEMNKKTEKDAWQSINFDERYRVKSLLNN